MTKINLGDISFDIPDNWEELIKLGHYLPVVNILSHATTKAEIYPELFSYFLDLNNPNLPDTVIDHASTMIVDEVYPCFNFIFEEVFTINPIPHFSFQAKTYYGPGDMLLPMCGAEMEECAWAYFEYIKTDNPAMLDYLIAVMYRKKRLFAFNAKDKRVAFDKSKTENNAASIANLDMLTKLGIKFWYENCESWWKKQHEYLYPKSETSDDAIDSLGISRLIRALAGQKRGTVADVRLMDRDEIFFELTELYKESEEIT
jgi:hypothetical protein